MHLRLNIFQQGVVLLAIPLVVQAVCIALLLKIQADGSRAQAWALHTKEVLTKVAETDRLLLEGHAAVRDMIFIGEQPGKPSIEHIQRDTAGRIDELHRLVSDNPLQQARLEILRSEAAQFLEWLAAVERRCRSGERQKALAQLNDGVVLLNRPRERIAELLQEEERLDRKRIQTLRRNPARQVFATVTGGLAIVGATLLLSTIFLRNLVKRLAALRENVQRLSEGRSLRKPLGGHDEIALLDRGFHDMASALEQQKQENDMFVYSVSHDLRSPLVNLQGFSQELHASYQELREMFGRPELPRELRERGTKLVTEGVGESLRFIQSAVSRLAGIIDGLLRLSRAGRVEYQLQKVDLEAAVKRIVEALHDSISSRQAQVQVQPLPPAWGDPTALEQIFANLIGNAVQYLDAARAGRIDVGSTESAENGAHSGFHVYYVRDNGLGIPESYQARVFTVFSKFQADVPQGEGVGLALVRRVVQRHGGKIWLESEAGAGSTFFVSLPSGPWDGLSRGIDEFKPRGEKAT
jgi:signal transduction histidine kinase